MREFDPNNHDGVFVPYRPISQYKGQNVTIVLHPAQYKIARDERDFFEPSREDVLKRNVYGFCGKATISVSTLVPKGKMCVIE